MVTNSRILRLRQSLFNTPPYKDAPYFTDNGNHKIWYSISGTPFDDYILYYKAKKIGRMRLIWRMETVELADIVIFSQHYEYRNNGIGTWLFSKMIEITKTHNIQKIYGRMHPETPGDWNRLKRFYKNQGCKIDGNYFYYFNFP